MRFAAVLVLCGARASPPSPPTVDYCAKGMELLSPTEPSCAGVTPLMKNYSCHGLNDPGKYHACQALTGAHYCILQAHQLDTVIDTQGICVPSACGASNIQSAIDVAWAMVLKLCTDNPETCEEKPFNEILKQGNRTATPNLIIHCGDSAPGPIPAGGWCTIVVLIVLASLVLAATLVQALDKRRAAAEGAQLLQPLADVEGSEKRAARPSKAKEMLLAFSLFDNVRFLVLPAPSRRFTALEGVRALSMFWIILAHTLDFQSYVGMDEPFEKALGKTLGNKKYGGVIDFQAVISASFAVDGFFLLSGFLGAHVLLRRPQHIGLRAFVLRYLRLTPTLALVLAIFATLSPQVGVGPQWFKMAEASSDKCVDWWWSNLLYLNNFAPSHFTDMCMGWTWYLACDTQMFLVTLPLLALRASKRPARRAAATVICAVGIAASAAATWILLAALDDPSANQDAIYDKFYTRIGPYLIGLLLCFVVQAEERSKAAPEAGASSTLKAPLITRLGAASPELMTGSVLVINGLVWSQFHKTDYWTKQGGYAYLALGRPAWALALAVLLWLCVTGRAPLTNYLLSLRVFDLPAKLTYAAYLVHPMIIRAYWFQQVGLTHYDRWGHIEHTLAFGAISYAVAFLVALLVELPSMNLIKLLMRSQAKPQPVPQPMPPQQAAGASAGQP